MAEDKHKERKRMVVEEVGGSSESEATEPKEDAPVETANEKPVEEIKEKVEELQSITEHMGTDIEKSADVQEELAVAADKVVEKPTEEAKPLAPYQSQGTGGPSALIILIPGVLLLGALLGGIYFYEKGVNQSATATPTPEATASEVPSASPTASPSAKLDLTKYPINVENGSGIPGTAGSVKDLLTKAGFKVGTTGNADNYNYTDTIIKTKSDVPAAFVTKLTTTLSGIYKVGTPQTLDDNSKDEVVVIVGTSKAQ